MTWDEYFEKFYDWAESTRIKKLSSVESLGDQDSVCDVMLEFSFNNEKIANRLAKKAIEQGLVFSADNIMYLLGCIDEGLLAQLVLQSADAFTKEQLEEMRDVLDEDLIIDIYKKKGLPIPDEYMEFEDFEEDNCDDVIETPKGPGFFATLGMMLAMGAGIKQGIDDVRGGIPRKYRVGDRVRVKYREQEGTVIDINGDLYMVSLNDGGYVDSYYENQLERA